VRDDTLCLDWTDVAAKRTRHTRAVIPVWYGGTVPPAPWLGGMTVVEDCAHACGSTGAGTIGDAACWSFQAVKNLATGDGGMITTGDARLADKLRQLRWCGIDRSTWERESRAGYSWDYDVPEAGHKAQMTDLAAALGLAQLERLDVMNKQRETLVRRYLDELGGTGWLRLPPWRDGFSWHLFCVRVPAADRDALISHLRAAGISAGVHYKPLTLHRVFRGQRTPPVTAAAWRELVTLPLFPDMTQEQQGRVIDAVKAFSPAG